MGEYYYLLTTEAAQLKPQLVVLCVFVGNDIDGFEPSARGPWLLHNWWLARMASRLVALSWGVEDTPSPPRRRCAYGICVRGGSRRRYPSLRPQS